MYRREGPKPLREPGFILPLIGCGCMYMYRTWQPFGCRSSIPKSLFSAFSNGVLSS
jgi:hypothetical protein